MTCDQADEHWATARVMGRSHMSVWLLLDHAIECPRGLPPHAMPTEWWPVAIKERTRKDNFEAFHA